MSNEKSSVDELAEQMGELTGAERAELFEGVRDDLLERYLKARGEYIGDLRERGLVGQYPDDSPWADYCREHPEDPMCHRILSKADAYEKHREYLDARREYVERLQEEGLMSFERGGQTPAFPGEQRTNEAVPLHSHSPTGVPILSVEGLLDPCVRYGPFACACDPMYCVNAEIPDEIWCAIPGNMCDSRCPLSRTPLCRDGFGLLPSQRSMTRANPPSPGMTASSGFGPHPGPFPQPFPDRIRTPRIDICELYPCLCNPHSCECNPNQPHCWFDICKLNPCFCNPCSPGCPRYFSCQCNDWPWCNLTIPESQFRPPVPSFWMEAMYPAGAAAGGGQSPMAPMGASSYRYHGY